MNQKQINNKLINNKIKINMIINKYKLSKI